MVLTFVVPKSELNPEIETEEVTLNGKLYTIKKGDTIYATDKKEEVKELKEKELPVVPMAVYEILKNAKKI